MRLTPSQQASIVSRIREQAGESARIFLYGSRIDDTARGGDIDILVESHPVLTLRQRASIRQALEQELALPIDLVACDTHSPDRPFVAIVRDSAVLLEE